MVAAETGYLRRGAVAMAVSAIGAYLLDYVLNIGLSRLLSPIDYGDYKIAASFVSLAGMIVVLGGDRSAIRFLPPLLTQPAKDGVWEFLRFFLAVAWGLSAVLALGFVAVHTLGWIEGPTDQEGYHPLSFTVLVVPFTATGALAARLLHADRRLGAANLPWSLGLPVVILLQVALAHFAGLAVTDLVVLGAFAFGTFLITAAQLARVWQLGLAPMRRRPDLSAPSRWLAFSIPMMLSVVLTVAMNQIDLYMCELLAPEHDVGHFGAAASTARFLTTAQLTVIGLLSPAMAAALAGSGGPDAVAMARINRTGFRILFAVGAAGILVMVLAGEWLLGLFGPSYIDAGLALILLSIGYGATTILAQSPLWLQYAGKGVLVTITLSLALVLDAGLNLALIPRFGMTGAAASTASSLLAAALFFTAAQYRLLRLNPLPIGALLTK